MHHVESDDRPRFDRGDLVYLAYLVLPFRVFVQLGRMAGWIEMLLRPAARRAVRANMDDAFAATKGRRERARLTRQVFEYHQTRNILLTVSSLMATRGQLERYFPIRDVEHLDRALAGGTSAMLLGCHVNSIGVLLAIMQLRRRGYDIRCPLPEARDAWAATPFRRLVHRVFRAPSVREAMGAFYAQFNVRPLISELKNGRCLLLMGDGWHSASFVDVEFLGRRLPFTTGPVSLARAAGVPIIPLFSVGPPGRMHFEFHAPVHVARRAPAADEVASTVRSFIGMVQAEVLRNIPCWQHWLEPSLFATLDQWRSRTIQERYLI